eukprot:CAMPEP_0174734068 /NCGR_PEP_ID=MMETSP1094-20130205/62548_1 /TAXON_ID=156173 /ORGANISM="Chrysochromulina brevifilum, Strain UTEX LB 985" /LENGTH=211 /DNA_ID=CAMNT_0015936815 /DNA_START=134 /DNA_END=766 /DNA_ORIENTATION=-
MFGSEHRHHAAALRIDYLSNHRALKPSTSLCCAQVSSQPLHSLIASSRFSAALAARSLLTAATAALAAPRELVPILLTALLPALPLGLAAAVWLPALLLPVAGALPVPRTDVCDADLGGAGRRSVDADAPPPAAAAFQSSAEPACILASAAAASRDLIATFLVGSRGGGPLGRGAAGGRGTAAELPACLAAPRALLDVGAAPPPWRATAAS